jgi:hypothetical protein
LAIYAPYRRFCVVIAKRRLVDSGERRTPTKKTINGSPAVAPFQHPPLISDPIGKDSTPKNRPEDAFSPSFHSHFHNVNSMMIRILAVIHQHSQSFCA